VDPIAAPRAQAVLNFSMSREEFYSSVEHWTKHLTTTELCTKALQKVKEAKYWREALVDREVLLSMGRKPGISITKSDLEKIQKNSLTPESLAELAQEIKARVFLMIETTSLRQYEDYHDKLKAKHKRKHKIHEDDSDWESNSVDDLASDFHTACIEKHKASLQTLERRAEKLIFKEWNLDTKPPDLPAIDWTDFDDYDFQAP
jgi:hypothetical protein